MQVSPMVELGVRAAMAILPLFALAFASAATRVRTNYIYYYMLGSGAITFVQLTTFVGMLYGLWFLGGVHLTQAVERPRLVFERAIDGGLALSYLVSASILAASDYNTKCDKYDSFVRCGNMTAAIVFTFFAIVPHLVTLALTLGDQQTPQNLQHEFQDPTEGVYVGHATPIGQATPVAATTAPKDMSAMA